MYMYLSLSLCSLGKFMRISGKYYYYAALILGLFFVLPYAVLLGFFQSELIHSLAVLLSNYCSYFGHTFTHNVVSNNSGTYKYPLSLILSFSVSIVIVSAQAVL